MQPFFIDSQAGPLFAVYWPTDSAKTRRAILHIPAFAEEMNKSRHMVALQARCMAAQGLDVLSVDLLGTGDSHGDFGDATWDVWLSNIADAIAWLRQRGVRHVTLWGLRLGALLAMHFVCRHSDSVDSLLLWQPVLKGDAFITQFLRLRVAATMRNSLQPAEKTDTLKQWSQKGQTLEVAGYSLHPDLIKPLLDLSVDQLIWPPLMKRVAIFEIEDELDNPFATHHTHLMNSLKSRGIDVSLIRVVDQAFWASKDVATSPKLMQETLRYIGHWQNE